MIRTSGSRSTPVRTRTVLRTWPISASMSAALPAPSGLTMKLACFSDTRAPPIVKPFKSHDSIADRVRDRQSLLEHGFPRQHFDARDATPCLAAVAARIHRERAADRSGNSGEKFGAAARVQRGEARNLRASSARFGVDKPVAPFDRRVNRMQHDRRTANAAVAHEQIAAEADDGERLGCRP